jgi:hypothetical protein
MTAAARHPARAQPHHVRSVDQADVRWFDQHLADDFMNTNPDGRLIDRAAFLARSAAARRQEYPRA